MKLKLLLILLMICISNIGYSQKLTVNSNVDVKETTISYKNPYRGIGGLLCYDIMSKDTIRIYIGRYGLAGYTFKLQISNGKIVPKVVKWTDSPEYDGKSSIELELSDYELEINDTVFKPGDTLRAKFTTVSKPHKYYEKKKFKGEIFHIIGGNRYEWKNGKSTHQKFWKNGKQVYTTQELKKEEE